MKMLITIYSAFDFSFKIPLLLATIYSFIYSTKFLLFLQNEVNAHGDMSYTFAYIAHGLPATAIHVAHLSEKVEFFILNLSMKSHT
jgi:hypothetical protein